MVGSGAWTGEDGVWRRVELAGVGRSIVVA
jgi:hypothetical protein